VTTLELSSAPDRFVLRGRKCAISLHASGLRHPRSLWWGGEVFTPYSEITHLALGSRVFELATRRGCHIFWRRSFCEVGAPVALYAALLERLRWEPDGAEQLARMASLDAWYRARPVPRTTWILPVLCVVLALLAHLSPNVSQAGVFSATLVSAGEHWRIATANLLHLGEAHLLLNVLGLVALGALLETAFGSAGLILIAGASGLGAMSAGWFFDYEFALGASGIVSGMAAAIVWLEFRCAEQLPAPLRFPRRLLIGVLAIEGLASLFLPFIAGAAHAGGFVTGLAASALLGGPVPRRSAPPRWLVASNMVLAALFVASLTVGARLALGDPEALEHGAERLLARPRVSDMWLNNYAWMIATARTPDQETLRAGLALARKAAVKTRHRDPNVLDTLAEFYFRLGDEERALAAIDAAITLAPEEPYFQEQRKRFVGERAADDRPKPPASAPPSHSPERPSKKDLKADSNLKV